MMILRHDTAPRYQRPDGTTSHLLAASRTCGASQITTSLVDVAPGGEQHIHRHLPEQVYYVLEGRGLMTVGNESAEVRAGDCIFVPSGHTHGIRNHTEAALRYFSAAAPAFSDEDIARFWPVEADTDQGGRQR